MGDLHTLIDLLDVWQAKRIAVVGDFMLDRTVFGNAERLSPDAPVPVLAVDREEAAPGGAANVCLDLRALRCKVECIGLLGDDEHGRRLRQSLEEVGCNTRGMLSDEDRPTTVKQSFVGLAQHRHPQKMFRADIEVAKPISDQIASQLLTLAEPAIADADVVCIEDYNKGVITEALSQGVIELARKHRKPVLVDPAAIEDYSKYRGATCITPNRTETALATGVPFRDTDEPAILHEAARQLKRELELDAVALTLDRQGLLLLLGDAAPQLVPTQARSVYDVTGAGDMVLAMLAAALANGIDWLPAAQLANVAGGLEVEKFGVVPIELDEILLSLLKTQGEAMGKPRTLEALLPELTAYRKQGRRVVFTNGCFDILHAGHVAFLREARRQGDLLVVGLNSDASITRLKGPERPVNREDDRVMVLSELESVDYIVVFEEDTPIELIKAILPDVLVKGADYQKHEVVGGKEVEAAGGEVFLVDLVEGRSTTNIIRRARGA